MRAKPGPIMASAQYAIAAGRPRPAPQRRRSLAEVVFIDASGEATMFVNGSLDRLVWPILLQPMSAINQP